MSTVIQSVIFYTKYWTLSKAVEWLVDHKLRVEKLDITDDSIRFRQITPESLKRNGYTEYTTKKLKDKYISFVLAHKPNVEINSHSR